jgi:dolichyl-phosphate beta-glucosyltransferase
MNTAEVATPESTLPPLRSVVIPAYNEQTRLPATLRATAEFLERRSERYEILVVDDGSRDQTVAVAQAVADELAATMLHGGISVLGYDTNRGKGHAVRFGVLRATGKQVLFMDADLATPIEELKKLEEALAAGADFAIGSRPLRQSQLLVRQPWYREGLGRLFNQAVQLAATPGIHDTQCGFKLLTRTAAHDIFSRCVLDGFSFDVEALFLARRLGYQIAEVPVRWAHQEGAAAFATRSAYVRAGLAMVADLWRIRRIHRSVRPVAAAVAGSPLPPA